MYTWIRVGDNDVSRRTRKYIEKNEKTYDAATMEMSSHKVNEQEDCMNLSILLFSKNNTFILPRLRLWSSCRD